MILGSRAFGKYVGHEGGALIIGTSVVYIKKFKYFIDVFILLLTALGLSCGM